MFEKKETIYKKKDRETWESIRKVLKEQGMRGVSAGHYPQDAVMAGGCGAKLDIRKFGRKEPIPTRIFHIEVEPVDGDAAKKLLKGTVKPVLSYGYNF